LSGNTTATTVTITHQTATSTNEEEVLPLTLRARPNVTWNEDVQDNEGLGRKSSKRCCIFHKQRAFGESSTDSSDDGDGDGNGSESSSSSGGGFPSQRRSNKNKNDRKPIARPKHGKVPNHQRYHA